MDHWLAKLERDREDRFWARLEDVLGLRFRREDYERKSEAEGAAPPEDDGEVFVPLIPAMNAIVTGIMGGGLTGVLRRHWGIPDDDSPGAAGGAPNVGPADAIRKKSGLGKADPEERDLVKGGVVNLFGFSKEQLFERFPLLKVRGHQPVAKKVPRPNGRPPGDMSGEPGT